MKQLVKMRQIEWTERRSQLTGKTVIYGKVNGIRLFTIQHVIVGGMTMDCTLPNVRATPMPMALEEAKQAAAGIWAAWFSKVVVDNDE